MFILAILGILFVAWLLWTGFLYSLYLPWPGCKPINYQQEIKDMTECYKETGSTDYKTFLEWRRRRGEKNTKTNNGRNQSNT